MAINKLEPWYDLFLRACALCECTEEEFFRLRTHNALRVRWLAMLALRRVWALSYPMIGEWFSINHSTVHHGVRRVMTELGSGNPTVRRRAEETYAALIAVLPEHQRELAMKPGSGPDWRTLTHAQRAALSAPQQLCFQWPVQFH
jgi:hypothetical protein